MTNKEIVDLYLSNGLIRRCVECQFAAMKDLEFREDFMNDLIIILYDYPNEKLLDAHLTGRMNALITAIIIRNIWSSTSPFFKNYKKFLSKADEITEEMEETIADEQD